MWHGVQFPKMRGWWLVVLGLVAGVRPSAATGVCGVPQTIACGQTLQGQLDGNSCVTSDNVSFDVFNFSGIQGQRITAVLSAVTLAPSLSVADPEGNLEVFVAASEVESGEDQSDTLSYTLDLEETSDQWQLVASTSQAFTTGRYALSLSCYDASPTCAGDGNTLCLNHGRFQVRATFDAGGGNSGQAAVVPLNDETGYLWFFSPANVEVIVKVLNGCGLGGHYWVFAGGLTNVNTIITVTDTATGVVRTYRNPANTTFQPIQDTGAFPTCP